MSRFREPILAREAVAARELARRCGESDPFRWLCGGVSVNHRWLSEFRTDHGAALDGLFTQVIASLVEQELVSVSRVSQDGVRVRVSAGAGSFRREERLRELRRQAEQALAQLTELKQQREAAARVIKMANGGFNPAVNVQLATDSRSRAIVGVEASNAGYDAANLSEPMRRQVEQRSGGKVEQHLLDGGRKISNGRRSRGWNRTCRRNRRGKRRIGVGSWRSSRDSAAIQAWKRRMASEARQEIYKQRASTSETVNGDLRCYRGLTQMTVRGLSKQKCVALSCALAYNLLHFGAAWLKSC